ncbi:phosphopantetheine-binding protein [Streptomyces sp. NPDC087218]|uniref:phosphopantetheine-binding protein n=1 Tax=unclassified Streptomyces TaxID=2593676 RepID=UPI0036987BE8
MSGEAYGNDGTDPSTRTEKMVAHIWQEVLEIEEITVSDNFFELGGHSLLAVQVMAMISEEIDVPELPVRVLIEAPTVAELARAIDRP